MQMEHTEKKRQRGTNFSKEEELLLLSEIEKYKTIVECKLADKANLIAKNKAWRKIMVAFNDRTVCYRNVEQLKVKYENIKRKARKAIATNESPHPAVAPPKFTLLGIDPVIPTVLRIINKNNMTKSNDVNDADNTNDTEIETALNTNFSRNSDVELEDALTVVKSELMDELNQEENCLQEAQTEEAPNCIESPEADQTSIVLPNINKNSFTESNNNTWCRYKTKKQKLPTMKKLRLIGIYDKQRAVKEYYKKKTQLIEEEIKKNRLEQEAIVNKKMRDEEEHNKRMKLIDLEIELKRTVLNNGKINY